MKKIIRVVPILAGLLVALFLSGKIIEIPHGTKESGIIGGVGVAVIGVFMFIIIFILKKFAGRTEGK